MTMKRTSSYAQLFALLVAACQTTAQPSETTGTEANRNSPPQTNLTMQGEDGTTLSGTVARLDLSYSEQSREPDVRIDFAAVDARGTTVTIAAACDQSILESGTASLTLTNGALQIGQAMMQSRSPDGTVTTSAVGELHLDISHGLHGTIDIDQVGEVRFEGPLRLRCAVPEAQLPHDDSRPPAPVGEGAVVLVVDQKLESSACRSVASRLFTR